MPLFNHENMKKGIILVFILSLTMAVKAQYDFTELTSKLESHKRNLGNDIVALVFKDGKIIYQKEIGNFNVKTQAPIASCSKWLTAALIMTFVDQGKISLDDKVSKYLPIFAKYGKSYITIRHCLSHQTGIEQEEFKLIKFLTRKKYKTLEEEVDDFASKKEIDFNPGTGFYYGNAGLNIAARIAEVVGRRNFETLMRERILRPLSMRNTTFALNYEIAVNPSGGAHSTANDYMNFLIMILNKGTFNGKQVLSESSIAEMQKDQIVTLPIKYAPKNGEGYSYGLGEWILEKDTNGNSNVIASPGLFGTWPLVDNKRKYACIFFVKNLQADTRREMYADFKESIDKVIGN